MKNFARVAFGVALVSWISTVSAAPSTPPSNPAPNPSPGIDAASAKLHTVNGGFSVTDAGAANYSIPINIPKGTGGLAPAISINYNSGAPNGIVGMGGSIGGIEKITRCQQKKYIDDGDTDNIHLDNRDRFCLNGQRLILASGGNYGAVGAYYKTLVDDYSTIRSHGGTAGNPDYWKIERKNGAVLYFGSVGSANGSEHYVKDINNTTKTYSWSVVNYGDVAGNKIRYYYTGWADTDNTGHRISQIRYAFGSDTATWPNDGNYAARIAFEYEERKNNPDNGNKDYIRWYDAGHEFRITNRLKKIKVFNRLKTSTSEKLLREYRVSYKNITATTRISRLKEIKECIGSECYKPLKFTWTADSEANDFGIGNTNAQTTFSHPSHVKAMNHQFADINGDGFLDLIWQAFGANSANTSIIDQTWYYSLSDGNKLGAVQTAFTLSTTSTIAQPYAWHVLDYNGDRKADILLAKDNKWKVAVSNSTGFVTTPLVNTNINAHHEESAWLMDVDGDGLKDLAVPFQNIYNQLYGDRFHVHKLERNGSSTSQPYKFSITPDVVLVNYEPHCSGGMFGCVEEGIPAVWGAKRWLGLGEAPDFNGDGLTDAVSDAKWTWGIHYVDQGNGEIVEGPNSQQYPTLTIYTMGNDGNLHEYEFLCDILNCSQNDEQSKAVDDTVKPLMADINNDGKTDLLVRFHNGKWRTFLSTGEGFVTNSNWDLANIAQPAGTPVISPIDGNIPTSNDINLQLTDWNGDGFLDAVYHVGTTVKVRPWKGDGWMSERTFKSGISRNAEISLLYTDINGDSYADLIRLKNSGSGYVQVYKNKNVGQERLKVTEIDNSLGGKTKINYVSLAREVYTPQSNGANANWVVGFNHSLNGAQKDYPVMDVEPAMYAVKDVFHNSPAIDMNQANPATPTTDTFNWFRYTYAGAKVQGGGHGFLGFQARQVLNLSRGMIATTTFRQDFPFTGRPLFNDVVWWNFASAPKNIKKTIIGPAFQDWTSPQKPYKLVMGYSYDTYYDFDTGSQTSQVHRTHYKNGNAAPWYDDKGNMLYRRDATYGAIGVNSGGTETHYKKVNNVFHDSQLGANVSKARGLLTQQTIEHKRPSESAVERVTRYDYFNGTWSNAATGGGKKYMLQSKTLREGNTNKHVTKYFYTDEGNVRRLRTEAKATSGNALQYRQRLFTYDVTGRFIDKSDVWDGSHWMTEHEVVKNASGEALRHAKFGTPLRTKDMTKRESVHAYDTFGHLYHSYSETGDWATTRRINGAGANCPAHTKFYVRVDTATAGVGQSIECIDGAGRVTRSLRKAFNGSLSAVQQEYDIQGRLKRVSAPFNVNSGPSEWSIYTYDPIDRKTKILHPHNKETNYTYGPLTVTVTNAKNQQSTTVLNPVGETLRVKDAMGGGVKYFYTSAGDLKRTEVKDSIDNPTKSIATTMTYDGWGQKTSMNDPDKGSMTYVYNNYGEIIKQTNAKGQFIENTYDELGRLTDRVDNLSGGSDESVAHWRYDRPLNNNAPAAPTKPGLLIASSSESTIGGVSMLKETEYSYDAFGRITTMNDTIDENSADNVAGTSYTQTVTYDQYGRIFQEFDASGFNRGLEYKYNSAGYLLELLEADKKTINGTQQQVSYYKVATTDPWGNVTKEILGNSGSTFNPKYTTTRYFDAKRGLNKWIKTDFTSIFGPSINVQNLNYTYDDIGNLRSKHDTRGNKDLKESYCYDQLNRLQEDRRGTLNVNCSNITNTNADYRYDKFGNITFKRGVGNYDYGSSLTDKPHAVREANNVPYNYDANGNMVSGNGRSISYTVFDKAHRVSKGSGTSGSVIKFRYGADRMRFWKEEKIQANATKKTHYVGNIEVIKEGGNTTIRRNIAGKAIVLLENVAVNGAAGTTKIRYLLRDNQSSIVTVLSDVHGTVQEMSYNPWGQRRDLVNLDTLLGPFLPNFGVDTPNRGYTDHEMVDSVGIIHMNGRIYDPTLGRMMQADPIVQSPGYTQSFNRYSYTFNNPLRFVDPSGYKSKTEPTVKNKGDQPMTEVCCGTVVDTGGHESAFNISGDSGANNTVYRGGGSEGAGRDRTLGNHLIEGVDYEGEEVKALTPPLSDVPRYDPSQNLFSLFNLIIGDASGTGYYTKEGSIVDEKGRQLKGAQKGLSFLSKAKDHLSDHLRVGLGASFNINKVMGATIDLGSSKLSDEEGGYWTNSGYVSQYSEGRTLTSLSIIGIVTFSAENTTFDNGKTWNYNSWQVEPGALIEIFSGQPVVIDVSIGAGIMYENTITFGGD